MKKFLVFALLLPLASAHSGMFPTGAFSDSARGTAAVAFMKLNPSVRSSALADSLSLGSADPAAGFHMPAAFIGLEGAAYASMTSGLLPEDVVQAAAYYGHRIGKSKYVIGTHQVHQPSLGLYDAFGTKTGDFKPTDVSVMFGLGRYWRHIPWGVNLNYIQTKIGPSISGNSAALGFGFAFPYNYFTDRNLSLGFAFSNLGPPIKIGSQDYPLPFRAQASLGYKLNPFLIAAVDLVAPVDQALYPSGAIEWKIPFQAYDTGEKKSSLPTPEEIDSFFESRPDYRSDPVWGISFMGGITGKNKTTSFSDKLSFGMRLYLSSLTLDAGAASFGSLGFSPRFSLTYRF